MFQLVEEVVEVNETIAIEFNMSQRQGESDENQGKSSEKDGVTALLAKFYSDSVKQEKDWSMKCRLCGSRTHSKPGVTSNFHRHLRVWTNI